MDVQPTFGGMIRECALHIMMALSLTGPLHLLMARVDATVIKVLLLLPIVASTSLFAYAMSQCVSEWFRHAVLGPDSGH